MRFRTMYHCLRNPGFEWNHQHVYRICQSLILNLQQAQETASGKDQRTFAPIGFIQMLPGAWILSTPLRRTVKAWKVWISVMILTGKFWDLQNFRYGFVFHLHQYLNLRHIQCEASLFHYPLLLSSCYRKKMAFGGGCTGYERWLWKLFPDTKN